MDTTQTTAATATTEGASMTDIDRAEQLAQAFHETYERLAPSYRYETRPATAVPWADVPEPNHSLMIAVAEDILAKWPTLTPTQPTQGWWEWGVNRDDEPECQPAWSPFEGQARARFATEAAPCRLVRHWVGAVETIEKREVPDGR